MCGAAIIVSDTKDLLRHDDRQVFIVDFCEEMWYNIFVLNSRSQAIMPPTATGEHSFFITGNLQITFVDVKLNNAHKGRSSGIDHLCIFYKSDQGAVKWKN